MRIIIILIVVSLLVIITVMYLGLTGYLKCSLLSCASTGQIIPVPANSSENVIFGVAATTNVSALRYAMSSGIKYFRVDIGNDRNQENFIQNVTYAGGHYIGILDYVTVGAEASPSGCLSGCNWTLSDWNASVENAVDSYPEVHI